MTTTQTVAVTSCVPQPAPTLCGNEGLQFAVFENQAGYSTCFDYCNFDTSVYKTATPDGTGVTTGIGGFDYHSDPVDIYGQVEHAQSFWVLNHQGYIYAPETGEYTITITNIDDSVYIWTGATAQSGWDNGNEFFTTTINDGSLATTSIYLTAKTYTPIRIMFAQVNGGATFEIDITAPDGSDFLGANSGASPYVVQYGCGSDLALAPKFQPWGQQT